MQTYLSLANKVRRKLSLNPSGFTLVEILIAVALMCVGSLGLMKLTQNHGMSVKTGEMDAEMMTTMNQVMNVLNSTNGCNATLSRTLTKVLPSADLESPGVDISGIRIREDSDYLTVGQVLRPGLTLTKIAVKLLKSNFDPASGKGSGMVEITFTTEGGFGGKTSIKRAPFYAKFSALSYYTVLTSDLDEARNSIQTACQSDLGTPNLSINILKTGVGSTVAECLPLDPVELYIEQC